ncbi:MAG: hypothetical protein IJ428_01020 [Clostridia bacterium]|nr:hypothetical protein [Clostridia bacterium]
MGNCKKIFSVLICAVLCLGMIIPALAADTALAPVEGGDPLAGIDASDYNIWCYDSADALGGVSAVLNAYVTKDGVRTKEMEYTVDPYHGVKCAATVCEPIGGALGLGNHRITTAFVGANKLIVDCSYVAVTYLTESNGKYGLVFRNTGGAGSVTLTEDTSVSGGKWTTVYVPITDANKTNIVTRMNKSFGNMGLIWDGAKKADETLYVREIVFFENEADAALYAEVAPAFYMGEKVVKKLPKTEEQQLKLNLMAGVIAAMRGAKWAVEDEKRTTIPTEWIEYEALFDMRSAAALDKTSATHADSGIVTYIAEKNDEAAKLEFTPGASAHGYYRIAFTPDAVNGIDIESGNYYAAVTYRADTEAALTLTAGNDSLLIAEETAVSTKWQTASVKIDANSDILKALADGNDKITLSWGQDAPNGSIEIKELVFFAFASRVEDYEKYAPIYYNSFYDFIQPKNPLDEIKNEIKFDFSNRSKLSGMLNLKDKDSQFVGSTSTLTNVEIDGISAIEISGLAENKGNAHALPFHTGPAAKNAFSTANTDTFYTAITYKADGEGTLVLHHGGNGTEGFGAVTYCNTEASDKWQTAVYAGTVGTKLLERMKNEYAPVFLAWNNTEEDENIYIKEIVFFTNKADAEKYGEGAAKYYNYTAGYEKYDTPQTTAPTDPLSGLSNYDKWTYASADTLTADGAFLNGISAGTVYAKDPNFAVRSLKLNGNSRFNTAFNLGNKLLVTPKYIAITYLTKDQAQASFMFNTYTDGGSGTIAADTSLSNGKWRTDYIELTDTQSSAIAARMNGAARNFAIDWTNANTNSEIYIREIVFFENEADVLTYAEKAPAYYNYAEDYSWNVDPLEGLADYDIWCYASQAALASNSAVIKQGATHTSDPTYGVECVKVTDAAFQTAFTAANQLAIDAPQYIAVTYMTPDTTACVLNYTEYKLGGTISSDISGSNGKWTTVYAELNSNQTTKLVQRLNGGYGANHFALMPSSLGNLYVREIVFFEDLADVQAYAAKAPVYYNYYSK